MVDYYYYYKYIGRFILFLKNNSKFFYFTDILKFNKLFFFFDIININDLNHLNILSHIFFFKYYFGIIPHFSNYTHKFKLNVHYYSFFIQCIFFKKDMYYPLYFFFNDVYFMINKSNIILNKEKIFWTFNVNDMNFFLEKKNTLGFYYLKYKLNFSFFFINRNNININNLFYLFKYKI